MKPTSRHDFKQSFLPAVVLSFICFTVLFYSSLVVGFKLVIHKQTNQTILGQ